MLEGNIRIQKFEPSTARKRLLQEDGVGGPFLRFLKHTTVLHEWVPRQALDPRTASIIELKSRANFQSFTSLPEREIWSLLCHCSPSGVSFAYLLCFYFNNAEIWKNSQFNAFTLTFDVTLSEFTDFISFIWTCDFAILHHWSLFQGIWSLLLTH